jgi:hypothetical protein
MWLSERKKKSAKLLSPTSPPGPSMVEFAPTSRILLTVTAPSFKRSAAPPVSVR